MKYYFETLAQQLDDTADDFEEMLSDGSYPEEVLIKFRETRDMCRKLRARVIETDYLVSGSIDYETFLRKWEIFNL